MLVNGFPKHGNHALIKACELLGVPVPLRVQHIPYDGSVIRTHLFIKRDPRNALVSWLRWQGIQVTPGEFLTAFRYFQETPLITEMAKYEGWLTDPWTLVVKYEDLCASDAEMRRIAAYLNVPYIEGAFEDLPGYTVTWNDVHSDYRTIWTPEVDAAWTAEGGPELLARWGY